MPPQTGEKLLLLNAELQWITEGPPHLKYAMAGVGISLTEKVGVLACTILCTRYYFFPI